MNDSDNGDNLNKVTCSAEDTNNVKAYLSHFDVPAHQELVDALDAFAAEPSWENQKEFKLQICRWLIECDHESFKDSLWEAPKKAAEEAVFDLQFDKDVKSTLAEDAEDEA